MKVYLKNILLLLLVGVVVGMAIEVARKSDATSVARQPVLPIVSANQPESMGPTVPQPALVFIGDFTDGSNEGGVGDQNWTALVGNDIRQTRSVRVVADGNGGGSGYVVRGSSPTFSDQVRSLVTADAKVVVISGSRSDVVVETSAITAAALETYSLVHTLAPRAILVVVGPTWGTSNPSDAVLATRDALREAAAASMAYFVDPIGDAWFTKGEPGLIGSDSVHPTDAGHHRISELMTPIVTAALNQAN
jgi:lysophospholipase L1-like esterase